MADRFEWYPTPAAFSEFLFSTVRITGRIVSPCCGDGAIQRAARHQPGAEQRTWTTNDLDARWKADHHLDAKGDELWRALGMVDWTVDNPPFQYWLAIAEQALAHSHVGVALHLRASVHEVLKTGPRRTWMTEHPPTGLLWLPRFAYQRSTKTGKWNQDSCCACWVVWYRNPEVPQFIHYAPAHTLNKLAADTPAYRAWMDRMQARRR